LRIFSTAYFVKDDESTVPLAVTSAPIILGKRLFGIVITFRDITKEKEVDKAKSNFVSIASHQLRTPLTGIRWLLETVLKKGHLNMWQMEFLNDALKSNNRMIGLVNNLLNLSRLDTGSIAIQPEDIELIKFINGILRDYKIMAKGGGKKLELKTKIKRLHINCDPQLLTQIVANLLSNAIKYTHKNTVVSVAIKHVNEFVDISVQDRGIGVSKEDQARLFTKFFRTEDAVRTSTAGSGLGLYIVKRILDAIGGKISFSSVPDKGSIVTFSLPIKGVKKKAGEKSIIGWRS
jgi:signal transduction histidine kinase